MSWQNLRRTINAYSDYHDGAAHCPDVDEDGLGKQPIPSFCSLNSAPYNYPETSPLLAPTCGCPDTPSGIELCLSAQSEPEGRFVSFSDVGAKGKTISVNPVNIDESILLRRAIYQQDRKAVAALHAKYYLFLQCYVASRINSATDAEDLAQDVFVELCKGNGQYDGFSSVKNYLLGVAANLVRRHCRRNTTSLRTIPIAAIGDLAPDPNAQSHRDPQTQISAQELKMTIAGLVAQLPPKAREALQLRFIDGLSYKKAAREAGCSVSTFYERVSSVLKELRKYTDESDHGRAS